MSEAFAANILFASKYDNNTVTFSKGLEKLFRKSTKIACAEFKTIFDLDKLDEAVRSGQYDILVCTEEVGNRKIGPASVEQWQRDNKYIRIVVLIDAAKKGKQKLNNMWNRKYYNALFDSKEDFTFSNIEYLLTTGRTAEEAYQYYGLDAFVPSDNPKDIKKMERYQQRDAQQIPVKNDTAEVLPKNEIPEELPLQDIPVAPVTTVENTMGEQSESFINAKEENSHYSGISEDGVVVGVSEPGEDTIPLEEVGVLTKEVDDVSYVEDVAESIVEKQQYGGMEYSEPVPEGVYGSSDEQKPLLPAKSYGELRGYEVRVATVVNDNTLVIDCPGGGLGSMKGHLTGASAILLIRQ